MAPFSLLPPSMMDFHLMSWLPYHPWVWHVFWIAVIIVNSYHSLCIFSIWWVTGRQRSIRRPPCPEDDNRNDIDEHRDNDNDDNDDHCGAVETIAGESDGAKCYLALGGRKNRRRERQFWLLPGTFWRQNDLVCGGSDGVVANGGRANFCGRSQQGPWENGQSGGSNGGASGHLSTLPPTTESVELISDTVWDGETGEVDEVPDGLYYVFWSSYISERSRPGPTT